MLDRRRSLLLLLVGGICTGLTLVIPVLGFLEWITLIPVGLFLLTVAPRKEMSLRSLYGYGLFFFFCYYLVTFEFFVNLFPLDFIPDMSPVGALVVVVMAWLGLSFLQAAFGGIAFVVMGLILRTGTVRRLPLLAPALLAGCWSVYEWTQNLGWWGVPWARLPLGQVKYLVGLQTASVLGSYAVTFVLVAVNLYLAYAILGFLRGRWGSTALRSGCAVAVLLLLVQYGAGTALWFSHAPDAEPRTVRVAVIQGNFSSQEKWSVFDTVEKTVERYTEYTEQAAEEGASIVIWPETALPYTVSEHSWLYAECADIARFYEVTLLVGCFTDAGDGRDLNSILCFLPDGTVHEQVYAKRRLVPFGEFVPMRPLVEAVVPPLADLVMSGAEIAPGEGANVMELEEGNVGCLICFDSLYEELARSSALGGAEMIALSTNDSWFTDSFALYLHNGQAQLRAIETGRWVARSANTGVSTFIDNRGRVLDELDPLVEGMLVGDVVLAEEDTPYCYLGNSFLYLWMIALAALLLRDAIDRILVVLTNKKSK